MTQSYDILIHKIFQEQSRAVVSGNQKIEPALVTSLQQIKVNPQLGGMKYINNPRLQGIVHKIHVGGRKGHRLIYIWPRKSTRVIPVYLSPVPKPPFRYEDVDWQNICDQFLEDYTKKNYEAFINL